MTFESTHGIGDRVMVYPPSADSYLATVDGVKFTAGKVGYFLTYRAGSAWLDSAFVQPITPAEPHPSIPEPLLPFDTWARTHNLIPVGSQLAFTARKDGRMWLFMVDMFVPMDIPDNVDPESFMRSTWLTSAEEEREKLRADGWVVEKPAPTPPKGCTWGHIDPTLATTSTNTYRDSRGALHITHTDEHGVKTKTVQEPDPPTPEDLVTLIRQAEWSADCQGEPACPWCRAERPFSTPFTMAHHNASCPVLPVLYP